MNEEGKKFLLENWFKLFISLMVFCAVAILAIQIFYLNPKKDEARANEILANQKLLDNCVATAQTNYALDFRAECRRRKLPFDCSLPLAVAKSYEDTMDKEINQCNKRYSISK